MNATSLAKKFEKMGARVKVSKAPENPRFRWPDTSVRLDVLKDKEGTYFDVRAGNAVQVEVLDVQPKERHLLLMARIPDDNPHRPDQKSKFLCGHDERDWFVAAIPESSPASSVAQAKEALKPGPVLTAQSKKKIKTKDKGRRKTDAYIRQGEWFFLATPDLKPDPKLILKNEPLQRGRGKPHMAQELYRTGGETVYVNGTHPNGISAKAYGKLKPEERKGPWRTMQRDPRVYVRGTIRHSDHKTIHLEGWHRVVPNTETEAKAMRHVAFLD